MSSDIDSDLRSLVKRTCHTPLLVAGQFVALYDKDIGLAMRKTVATIPEMLLALEFAVRTLQMANAYLRTQIRRQDPDLPPASRL